MLPVIISIIITKYDPGICFPSIIGKSVEVAQAVVYWMPERKTLCKDWTFFVAAFSTPFQKFTSRSSPHHLSSGLEQVKFRKNIPVTTEISIVCRTTAPSLRFCGGILQKSLQ
jgi:hypothetical protein